VLCPGRAGWAGCGTATAWSGWPQEASAARCCDPVADGGLGFGRIVPPAGGVGPVRGALVEVGLGDLDQEFVAQFWGGRGVVP